MSIFTIVNDMRGRKSLGIVNAVMGSGDTGVQQMVALLQDIGDELAERNFWKALDIAGVITGDGVTTLWPQPADFGGLSPGLKFVSTLFPLQPLVGPVTDEDLAALKAFPVGPIRPVWRVINGQFEFWPALAAGEVVTYNYFSPKWIVQSGGTRTYRWQSDSDASLIDEKILTTGLEFRWLQEKGLDYAEAEERYEARIERADGRQPGRRVVSMSSARVGAESTWPGVIPTYSTATGSAVF